MKAILITLLDEKARNRKRLKEAIKKLDSKGKISGEFPVICRMELVSG